ncbi:hypothetical protein CISIN_1g048371mg [Citrus sinensis]|uniref:Uncharacterized protein n=1 Tax=Citrus sinensis TaxID=2711 RepID=A0A067GWS2_CITSI|nr:hypothetical protein CISIN_1g048371mg [Citrus sinensis]
MPVLPTTIMNPHMIQMTEMSQRQRLSSAMIISLDDWIK